MSKLHDTILGAPALHGRPMLFRARIYENYPLTVALLSDVGDKNPGCSITNGIEYAAAAVIEQWPEINPARLVIVEHYDDREKWLRLRAPRPWSREETFDLVTFAGGWEALRQAALCPHGWRKAEPRWKHTTKADVERIIGEELP